MTILNSRARGLVGVRAESRDATQILNELTTSFETFKAERTKELDDINAKLGDVVQTEKVDRINAEVAQLNKSLTEAMAAVAALQVGAGASSATDPDKVAHAAAFDKFFRGGAENGLKELEVKAKLTTQSDPDGGYLVPEEMEAEVDRVLGTVSAVRAISRVVQVSADEYAKLVNMGGAQSGWVGEEQARSETAGPSLRKIVVNSGEIYANPAATQRMLDDGRVDIAAWLADEVSIEFGEQEGEAFVIGNGVNKPRGFLTYDMVANASYAWGKIGFVISGKNDGFVAPTTSVSPADALIDLHGSLRSGYRTGANWMMSDKTETSVRKFKTADGAFLWAPPSTTAAVATILGKPVVTDDNMPDVGADKFPIAFGNFKRGYLITDRTGVRVLRDPFTNKPNVHFYTTKRVGGAVVNFEAIKVMKIAQ